MLHELLVALFTLHTLQGLCFGETADSGRKGEHPEFGYQLNNGPKVWPSVFPGCGGRSQSPIHIRSDTLHGSMADPLHFSEQWYFGGQDWPIRNTGNTAETSLPADYVVTGAGLPGVDYNAALFHFHWGDSDVTGSEHVIDFVQYPLEMHVVTWNSKFASLDAARGQPEGVAILSIMFEVTEEDNWALDPVIKALQNISKPGLTGELAHVLMMGFMEPAVDGYYYRYSGSFTTPPCEEMVTWSVFWDPVFISKQQLQEFCSLETADGTPLVNNYRPPQQTNSRTVTAMFS